MRTAKALARLRGCAGLPEPSLVAYVIRSWLNYVFCEDELKSQKSSTQTEYFNVYEPLTVTAEPRARVVRS